MGPQPPWEGPLQRQSHAPLSLVKGGLAWIPCCYWTLPADLGLEGRHGIVLCRHCCQSLCQAIDTLPSEMFVLACSVRQILSTVAGVTIYMEYAIPHQTFIHDSRKSTEYIYGIWHYATSATWQIENNVESES